MIDDPLAQLVSEHLGIRFQVTTNRDLRPTQQVETVNFDQSGMHQASTIWGIQPPWAKRILINAQAETIAGKRTFADSFKSRRCLLPCSGWYEWRAEGGPRKTKYLFSHAAGDPLYMAAIWYPKRDDEDHPRIVTLTTAANQRCAEYHHRMPVLIPPDSLGIWLEAEPVDLAPLLLPVEGEMITIESSE